MQASSDSGRTSQPSELTYTMPQDQKLLAESSYSETNLSTNENSRIKPSPAEKSHGELVGYGMNFTNLRHDITYFPPELHIQIAKFLDSQALMALRLSNSVFHRNIGTNSVKNQIKTEFATKKIEVEQEFTHAVGIDNNEKPIGDYRHRFSTFDTREDRKSLIEKISEILRDKRLSKHIRERYATFNKVVQQHQDENGKLPPPEHWDNYLNSDNLQGPRLTWISSLTVAVIHGYHQ